MFEHIIHRQLNTAKVIAESCAITVEDALVKVKSAEEITATLEKAKALPIGTIRKRPNGFFRKVAMGWEYFGPLALNLKDGEVISDSDSLKRKEQSKGSKGQPKIDEAIAAANSATTSSAKISAMVKGGIKDPAVIADMTKVDLSEVLDYFDKENILVNQFNSPLTKEQKQALPKVPVKERWGSYRLFLDMVAEGMGKSAIAYGTGGVGKTFTLKQSFAAANLKEFSEEMHIAGSDDYDYVKITGKSTPTAMYKALYEHNGKVVVFDDCDSVLQDETSINILKGALDTTGDGTISYGSGKPIKGSDGEPIPQRFPFQGRAVFISNLPPDKMPQPLRSRAFTVDLTMTASETIEMMKEIVHKMPFQDTAGNEIVVSREDRQAAVDFLDKYKDQVNIGDLNARTLGQIALIKKKVSESNVGLNWETAAMAMLT